MIRSVPTPGDHPAPPCRISRPSGTYTGMDKRRDEITRWIDDQRPSEARPKPGRKSGYVPPEAAQIALDWLDEFGAALTDSVTSET